MPNLERNGPMHSYERRAAKLKDLRKVTPPGTCLWDYCRKPTGDDARLFCSDKCAINVRMRTSPQIFRAAIFARDRGVCAKCGIDTEAQRKEWILSGYSLLVKLKFDVPIKRSQFWDADHIVPVHEAPELQWDPTNIQTLCCKCHSGKSTDDKDRKLAMKHVWLEAGRCLSKGQFKIIDGRVHAGEVISPRAHETNDATVSAAGGLAEPTQGEFVPCDDQDLPEGGPSAG